MHQQLPFSIPCRALPLDLRLVLPLHRCLVLLAVVPSWCVLEWMPLPPWGYDFWRPLVTLLQFGLEAVSAALLVVGVLYLVLRWFLAQFRLHADLEGVALCFRARGRKLAWHDIASIDIRPGQLGEQLHLASRNPASPALSFPPLQADLPELRARLQALRELYQGEAV